MTSTFQDRTGSIAGQLAIKAPVDVSTTANITLSGEQTIDGVLTAESRVLVKNQTDAAENGIYDSSSGSWTRTLDFDGNRDVVKGCLVRINAGTIGAGKTYAVDSDNPIVIDTDDIDFVEWTVASSVTGVLLAMGSNVASSGTVDLGASDSDYVTITGTTTITSLGSTTTKNHVWVKFSGALTLTHNGTSLILPTGANITTVAGDVAEFVRISGSNWQCLSYLRADGTAVNNQYLRTESNIASATTTTLTTATNVWAITGTTTITGFGSSASATYPVYLIRFTGALTLTHNGTSLILPGSANITTANGDSAVLLYLGSGNWKCLHYTKVSGKQIASIARSDLPDGCIVQRNYATYTANTDLTTAIPKDSTIPQSSEGTEVVTASLTPTSTTNRVRVTFSAWGVSSSGALAIIAAMFVDSGADAVQVTMSTSPSGTEFCNLIMHYEYVPGDTNSHTYKIRVGGETTGAVRLNGDGTGKVLGANTAAVLIVEEIKAS